MSDKVQVWRGAWALGESSADDAIVLDGLLPALSGRRDWAGPTIDRVGLLVGPALLVTEALNWATGVAPTLRLTLHCANTWDQRDCEATLTAAEGKVTLLGPQVKHLRPRTEDEEFDWLLVASELLQG